jgi:3-hydroxymyristoyl/3-hydroxydecanoyl-(acyl carrier protein) dehydratase
MIIQKYTFAVRQGGEAVYEGNTVFGFFSREALAQQVGLRDVRPWEPTAEERNAGRSFPYPRGEGFPDDRWRMVDQIDCYLPHGGPHGLGWVEASIDVDPSAWFFKAHFYQDPVWPGSLGLEALVQLLRLHAERRWGKAGTCHTLTKGHSWLYRGQVIPASKRVRVLAEVKRCSDEFEEIVADGWLIADGRLIYQMRDFRIADCGLRIAD